jgi:hypothetical protein
VRLDQAAENVLIASTAANNRPSRRPDVVDAPRVVTAQAQRRWLRATGEARDSAQRRSIPARAAGARGRLSHRVCFLSLGFLGLFDQNQARVPLGFAVGKVVSWRPAIRSPAEPPFG